MFRKQIYNINVVAQSTLYRHVSLSLDKVFFIITSTLFPMNTSNKVWNLSTKLEINHSLGLKMAMTSKKNIMYYIFTGTVSLTDERTALAL